MEIEVFDKEQRNQNYNTRVLEGGSCLRSEWFWFDHGFTFFEERIIGVDDSLDERIEVGDARINTGQTRKGAAQSKTSHTDQVPLTVVEHHQWATTVTIARIFAAF